MGLPGYLLMLAAALARAGQLAESLTGAEQGLESVEKTSWRGAEVLLLMLRTGLQADLPSDH